MRNLVNEFIISKYNFTICIDFEEINDQILLCSYQVLRVKCKSFRICRVSFAGTPFFKKKRFTYLFIWAGGSTEGEEETDFSLGREIEIGLNPRTLRS